MKMIGDRPLKGKEFRDDNRHNSSSEITDKQSHHCKHTSNYPTHQTASQHIQGTI